MRPFVAVLGLILLAVAVPVTAATFVVNSTADAVDATPGNGVCLTAGAVCTLRAAVQEANALPGPDIINLPGATHTLTIAGINEDAGATGDLDVTDALTINAIGIGATVDAGGLDRAFDLAPGPYTFIVNGVTITNGNVTPADFDHRGGGIGISTFVGPVPDIVVNNSIFTNNRAETGGAIAVYATAPGGNLTIDNSSFDGNMSTDGDGAAIFFDDVTGAFSVTDSTFGTNAANVAEGDGGAIAYVMQNDPSIRTYDILRSTFANNRANDSEGGALYYCCGTFDATIVESTISGNQSVEGGGGIYTCCGGTDELTITNSTISGNIVSGGDGGAIDVEGDVTLLNTTIAQNQATIGGGVSLNGGTLTTRNTLYSNNTFGDCGGNLADLTSQGGNLSSDTSCSAGFDGPGDIIDGATNLGPLADNGGPTETHALLAGSEAIDAAVAGFPPTDQRGVARPLGAGADIGSFEAAAAPVLLPTTTSVSSSVNPSAVGQAVTFTATVTESGAGTPTGTVTFRDGVTVLGTVPLNGAGIATLTTSALGAGTHSITATYSGDGTFATSTSAPLLQVVSAAAPAESIPALDPRALALLASALAVVAAMVLRKA
jgi:CSLREA domain-containing protein